MKLRARARTTLGLVGAVTLVLIAGALPAAATPPTTLFFSEYIEGSSNNKALEIYNGTGAVVDLAAGSYLVQVSVKAPGAAVTASVKVTTGRTLTAPVPVEPAVREDTSGARSAGRPGWAPRASKESLS